MSDTSKPTLAQQLHEWYLAATAELSPEFYNPEAQKSFDELTPEQQYIDRFIAGKVERLIADIIGEDLPVEYNSLDEYKKPIDRLNHHANLEKSVMRQRAKERGIDL